jgi:CheY-like chemotaxis protein
MKKIMSVEDNPDHAFLIRKGLEDASCSVSHYEDGPSAMSAAEGVQNREAAPDLVLLDLQLPGMDGFGVLTRLRKLKLFKRVPIVMLTTSGRQKEIDEAYHLGATGYVVKSEDFDAFKAKLKHVKDYWLNTVEFSSQDGDTP